EAEEGSAAPAASDDMEENPADAGVGAAETDAEAQSDAEEATDAAAPTADDEVIAAPAAPEQAADASADANPADD
ncbi:MAG: hypothetical protein AAGH15_02305, partial [Myxococcota bacterium]